MAHYAFGCDTVDGTACPARAAGYMPGKDNSVAVAGEYDDAVRSLASVETSEGVVPEEVARDAWLRAVDELRSSDWSNAADVGEQIADELGWVE